MLRHRQKAVRFAAGMVGDSFTAEDIVQEAFAKAWFRLDGYRPSASFKSWLYTIIRNRCIDHLRSSRPSQPLEWAEALPAGPTPEELLVQKEEWREFSLLWNALGEEARCALYLFAVEEMSYADIGKAMEKNTGQVKMIIYRARKKLAGMKRKESHA